MVEALIDIELSTEDRRLYRVLEGMAIDEWEDNDHIANEANFNLLRAACCTAEAVALSGSKIAERIRDSGKFRLSSRSSSKFEAEADRLEDILAQGEKAVVFSAWPNLVGDPFVAYLCERGLTRPGEGSITRARVGVRRDSQAPDHTRAPVLTYKGSLTDRVLEAVLDSYQPFERGPAVLVCSDAGQDSLNLYAPYLSHLDTPTTFAAYKQRRDRVHRIDSLQAGIERVIAYRYRTLGTIEESVESMMQRRREAGEGISGQSLKEAVFRGR